jgi:hypothetical protein
MHISRPAPAFPVLLVFVLGFAIAGHSQDKKTFPTDDEVNLLLTQADRAVQLYKPLIEQEEVYLGKVSVAYAEAVARDRQVVDALEVALKALKGKPQGFNGPAGFLLIMWLDDADHNALLCHAGALHQSYTYVMAGDMDKANNLIAFSQACLRASALLFTVSESAFPLYQRYLEAERQLAERGFEAAQRCVEALKQKNITPKK